MSIVLKSVEWGNPALSLLSHCKELDPNLPAVMHIRHSERPRINSVEDRGAMLTETGKKAAYEFGVSLPTQRSYRIFHSPSGRARETAEMIQQGLTDIGAETAIKGNVDLRLNGDWDRVWHYLKRDVLDRRAENGLPFFINLIGNHYSPSEFESSLSFSQRIAEYMMDKLHTTPPNVFDIYVSHDISIACFLLHWCGVLTSSEWIKFLDGFILQLTDDRINLYRKDRKKEAYHPYWWKNP